jgi:integrase/recombinase XerD
VRTLTEAEVGALLRAPASLREQALWHLLRDSGAKAETVLGLDASALDLRGRRARVGSGAPIEWSAGTNDLLGWLLAGRRYGPVFRTDRRAPAGTPDADICPLSGRGRMSYRRAAEIFAEHTRSLDPAGRGWMLHQLRRSHAVR